MGQITFRKSHFSRCSLAIFLGHPIMELAPKRMCCLRRFPPGRVFYAPPKDLCHHHNMCASTECLMIVRLALSCSVLFPGTFLGWDRSNPSWWQAVYFQSWGNFSYIGAVLKVAMSTLFEFHSKVSRESLKTISKGRHPLKKVANFRALPKLANPPPPPNSGNLVLFFPDVKTTFYAYDRKKYQWW